MLLKPRHTYPCEQHAYATCTAVFFFPCSHWVQKIGCCNLAVGVVLRQWVRHCVVPVQYKPVVLGCVVPLQSFHNLRSSIIRAQPKSSFATHAQLQMEAEILWFVRLLHTSRAGPMHVCVILTAALPKPILSNSLHKGSKMKVVYCFKTRFLNLVCEKSTFLYWQRFPRQSQICEPIFGLHLPG